MSINRKLKIYSIVCSILILLFASYFIWENLAQEEVANIQLKQIEHLAQPIYIDREVEKIVTETVIVTEYVAVESPELVEIRDKYLESQAKREAHYEICSQEYHEATIVWRYLTEDCGYSAYIAAGILGNLMNETGGNTLSLQPLTYGGSSKGYYGICQWSLKYHPEVDGIELIDQLDYLVETMPEIFDASGNLYSKDFNYQKFCDLTDVCEATLAFMKIYERPSSKTTSKRQLNALKAYQYFVIDN